MCEKTEFEVEGWRKIPPLIDILYEQNIPFDEQARMKLEIIQTDALFEKEVFDEAFEMRNSSKLKIQESLKNPDSSEDRKTIRHSWLYKHFKDNSTKLSKIALYVNAVLPIDETLDVSNLNSVGNHCVVVNGLAKWPKNRPDGIECLELENNGGCEQTRFIPVDFPFFEEVQIDVNKLHHSYGHKGTDIYHPRINNFGKKLVEKKWGKFETIGKNWYKQKKVPKEGQKKDEQSKYELLFVRGRSPCFQLKFTS